MRLIDADDLKEAVKSKLTTGAYYPHHFISLIDNAPTVEPKKEIVPVCKVTFDKEQLQEIVDKKVAELVADNKRPQVAYLCKYHKEPHYCKHTTRIEDALNFVKIGDGKYIEKEASHG